MGRLWSLSLMFSLGLFLVASAGEGDEGEVKNDEGSAAEAAEAPPSWVMPDKDRKKLRDAVADYLRPGRKTRQEMLEPLAKLVEKEIDGHSAFEDVGAWVEAAMASRESNPRAGRKGTIKEVDVAPDVHGFPGGVGTVKYHVYLPKDYSDREVYPILFCLPDGKEFPDPERYIHEQWVKASATIETKFIVVVPTPASKGDSWTKTSAYARAMIALRHALGTFDSDKKEGGPSSDARRLFLAGDDVAALVTARFGEMIAGAVLFHADGKATGGPNLLQTGAISGVPAYVVCDPAKKRHREFGERIKAANDASVIADGADAEAIAVWLDNRAPVGQPSKLDYTVHEGSFQRHHWITVLGFDAGAAKGAPGFSASADRATGTVRVEVLGLSRFELFLSDALVDLSAEIRVVIVEGGKEYEFFKDKATRDLGTLLGELVASNHPWRIYPVRFVVDVPQLRERQVKLDAAAAAQKAAEEAAKEKGASTGVAVGGARAG